MDKKQQNGEMLIWTNAEMSDKLIEYLKQEDVIV